MLCLTVSEEEDEILGRVPVELLQVQSVVQGPLGPRIPKLGFLLLFCVWKEHQSGLAPVIIPPLKPKVRSSGETNNVDHQTARLFP